MSSVSTQTCGWRIRTSVSALSSSWVRRRWRSRHAKAYVAVHNGRRCIHYCQPGMAHPPSFVLARPACCFRRQDNTGGFNDDKLKANGESLVEEESIDEYVVERRKRSRWARAKRRFVISSFGSTQWTRERTSGDPKRVLGGRRFAERRT